MGEIIILVFFLFISLALLGFAVFERNIFKKIGVLLISALVCFSYYLFADAVDEHFIMHPIAYIAVISISVQLAFIVFAIPLNGFEAIKKKRRGALAIVFAALGVLIMGLIDFSRFNEDGYKEYANAHRGNFIPYEEYYENVIDAEAERIKAKAEREEMARRSERRAELCRDDPYDPQCMSREQSKQILELQKQSDCLRLGSSSLGSCN